MSNLPIRKVPGIGRVSERVLTSLGIHTCSDVYTHRGMLSALDNGTISALDKGIGLRGLCEAYLGLGSNVVEPPSRDGRRSIGAERFVPPLIFYSLRLSPCFPFIVF